MGERIKKGVEVDRNWNLIVHQFKYHMPIDKWDHKTHLVIALSYLLTHVEIYRAFCHFKADLILHNNLAGIKNTATKGYHETITMFWFKVLERFLKRHSTKDFAILINDLLSDPDLTDKGYVYRFYSEDVIKSVVARAIYVAP